jgi:hypothetical protein
MYEPHVWLRPESVQSGKSGPSLNPSDLNPSPECIKLYRKLTNPADLAIVLRVVSLLPV